MVKITSQSSKNDAKNDFTDDKPETLLEKADPKWENHSEAEKPVKKR